MANSGDENKKEWDPASFKDALYLANEFEESIGGKMRPADKVELIKAFYLDLRDRL